MRPLLPSVELPSLLVVAFLLSRTLDDEVLVEEVLVVVYWSETTAGALALDEAISSSSYSTVWMSKPVLSVVGSNAGRPHLVYILNVQVSPNVKFKLST